MPAPAPIVPAAAPVAPPDLPAAAAARPVALPDLPTAAAAKPVARPDLPTAPAAKPVAPPDLPTAPTVAPFAPALGEEQLVERVLADLQRQVDLMLEVRLREVLAPVLARAADTLVREARKELTAALRQAVARAVADELGRRKSG